MIEERAEPEDIVEEHGLGQISDSAELEAVIAGIVASKPRRSSSTAPASSRCSASSSDRS